MLTDKKAQEMFDMSEDYVRHMVERMILIIENENPANVDDESAIDSAMKYERVIFGEMLRHARNIVKQDIKNIRAID